VTPTPEPTPAPVEPPSWTPATAIAYLASLVIFVLGVLTIAGVTIPASVSADVQLFAGAGVSVVGGLISVVVYIYRSLVQRAAIAQGYPVELAMRL
jgi:hypothetical protein